MTSRKAIKIEREALYQRVWETPMTELAKEFGVSDVGLAKVCKKMEVPRPPRGYWNKVAAGRSVPPKPKLPAPSRKGVPYVVLTPSDQISLNVPDERPEQIPFPDALMDPLLLTQRTLNALQRAKPNEYGVGRAGIKKHWDILVSQEAAERACLVMDTLVKALEARGCQVKVTGDESLETRVTVDGEEFSIGIEEKVRRVDHVATPAEKKRWAAYPYMIDKYDHVPTGQLKLMIKNAYQVHVRKQWADGKVQRLENCLGAFIRNLRIAAKAKKAWRAEEERLHQEWKERERREAERRRLEHLEKMRIEKISGDISNWEKAQQVKCYVQAMEGIQADVEGLGEWIAWAKRYADRIDPFSDFDNLVFNPMSDSDNFRFGSGGQYL